MIKHSVNNAPISSVQLTKTPREQNSDTFFKLLSKMGVEQGTVAFTAEQIVCICDTLTQADDTETLARFLDSLPQLETSSKSPSMPLEASELARDSVADAALEVLLKAKALVAYRQGRFSDLYAIIQSRKFSSIHHAALQDMWYSAHYREAEMLRGRALGAVDKYRQRRKHPLPRSIWDGEDTVYCFKV